MVVNSCIVPGLARLRLGPKECNLLQVGEVKIVLSLTFHSKVTSTKLPLLSFGAKHMRGHLSH